MFTPYTFCSLIIVQLIQLHIINTPQPHPNLISLQNYTYDIYTSKWCFTYVSALTTRPLVAWKTIELQNYSHTNSLAAGAHTGRRSRDNIHRAWGTAAQIARKGHFLHHRTAAGVSNCLQTRLVHPVTGLQCHGIEHFAHFLVVLVHGRQESGKIQLGVWVWVLFAAVTARNQEKKRHKTREHARKVCRRSMRLSKPEHCDENTS